MPRAFGRFTEDAVLIRQTAGARSSAGVFVSGSESQTPIKVATAPMRSKTGIAEMRDVLPAGARHTEERTFWVNMPLSALRRGAESTDSDYIEYREQIYRVQGVSQWDADGFTEVECVLPDVGDATVPSGVEGFNNAPIIFPLGVVHGVPGLPIVLDIPDGEITVVDTLLTRADVSAYHTLGLSAVFPTFIQLISVQYLLTHDGLDTPIGYFHFEHTVNIAVTLVDTLVLRFDLRNSGEAIGQFQIRGIG